MDAWLDAFLTLDRYALDGVQICTRTFCRLIDERLTEVCLRHLDDVRLCFHFENERIVKYSAALNSGTRRVDVQETELDVFAAKLKGVLLPSTIVCLSVNAGDSGNIGKATGVFNDIWSRSQVQGLAVALTNYDDPQICYEFILSASPQSCHFDFARVVDEGSVAGFCGNKRAPSQFFTDRRLRECLANKITQLNFEHVLPADAKLFPLSDNGIVDFLFGNPELKRKRRLTGGHTSASRNLFKSLVQAHLESEVLEDISLDLDINSFYPQSEMDNAAFEENLLDYGEQEFYRFDSSVHYEFPGEMRLQIVILSDKLQMRRGRRRGWKWMSREEREKWLEDHDDFDNWSESGNGDDEVDRFFVVHDDYTDYGAIEDQ